MTNEADLAVRALEGMKRSYVNQLEKEIEYYKKMREKCRAATEATQEMSALMKELSIETHFKLVRAASKKTPCAAPTIPAAQPEPMAWTGCGECDVAFPCHMGKQYCLRLHEPPVPAGKEKPARKASADFDLPAPNDNFEETP